MITSTIRAAALSALSIALFGSCPAHSQDFESGAVALQAGGEASPLLSEKPLLAGRTAVHAKPINCLLYTSALIAADQMAVRAVQVASIDAKVIALAGATSLTGGY